MKRVILPFSPVEEIKHRLFLSKMQEPKQFPRAYIRHAPSTEKTGKPGLIVSFNPRGRIEIGAESGSDADRDDFRPGA
jgi:hypothetical protein